MLDNKQPQDKSTKDTISQHKTNLLLTGELSDFQLQNLKTWPMIVFQKHSLEKVSIHYDFKLDGNSEIANSLGLHAGKITYDFDFKANARITKKEKERCLNHLTFWVKYLFWNDTEVNFKRRGRPWT